MAPLLAVAGARVVAWDSRSVLIGLNALTPLLFLPAWPVAVAAGWANRAFRRLLDLGLTDAAAARGQALDMTWPRDRPLLPPVIRIDHVLTTRGLVVTRLRTGRGRGSDHRPLVADVARTSGGG